jgi:hypothetical protein
VSVGKHCAGAGLVCLDLVFFRLDRRERKLPERMLKVSEGRLDNLMPSAGAGVIESALEALAN